MIKILDHGYLRFVEAWGTGDAGLANRRLGNDGIPEPDFECGIIEAARQSTQGSFRGWEQDEKLLKHLYSNKHMTPFEFAGLTIEVQAPIVVFREWHRHRTQSYNEMSARYNPVHLPQYIPTSDRVMQVNEYDKNKQAGNVGGIQLSPENAMKWFSYLESAYLAHQFAYDFAIKVGIAKELARLSMPVANYSRMRATGNLRNWLAFMTLRCDPDAQWEIRQYAQFLASIIREKFPRTYARWCE